MARIEVLEYYFGNGNSELLFKDGIVSVHLPKLIQQAEIQYPWLEFDASLLGLEIHSPEITTFIPIPSQEDAY